ncbi:hypothetical protein [Saccharopolyspora sp. NPDC050642]|uniref:hypothetical protein n=1 Tax=Saccharopolyspora sp. NPDC050642 TaxID=3157099 RepID=UPI003410C3CA
MADEHVLTVALTELLKNSDDGEVVRAVRGEMFFHFAVMLDLVAECMTALGKTGLADRAQTLAHRYREQGRAILGRVA